MQCPLVWRRCGDHGNAHVTGEEVLRHVLAVFSHWSRELSQVGSRHV